MILGQAITYRKVLEDDKHGRQRIELEHEAEWRFLVFGGRFLTRLFVQQDKQAGTVWPAIVCLICAYMVPDKYQASQHLLPLLFP